MEIITRKEAQEKGFRYYFTGIACKHGHISLRFTDNYGCVECHKILVRKIAEKNGVIPWSKTEEERRERRKQSLKRYAEKHLDRIKNSQIKYRNNNAEKIKLRKQKWASQNLISLRLKSHRRRGKTIGKLSKNIIDILLVKQKNKCAICKMKLNKNFHLDHIVAISKGGLNIDSNVQLLHPTCNIKKGAKDPIEFMQSLGYLL